VENVFVVDGAGFPTSLGVNPTLTMMANAWRACEYITETYSKGRAARLAAVR
jgi:choline dehydrogenase-like flavoprotein